jgi:hypothetical protein
MEGDDNYQAAGGGRKKGYGEDAANYKFGGPKEGITRAERGCTDCPFLVIFLAFIGSMVYVTIIANKEGDLKKLIAPLDGDNSFCGVTDATLEYPNLFITDFTKSSVTDIFDSAVCVKECPKLATDAIECVPTSKQAECVAKEAYPSKRVVNICFPTETPDSIKQGFKQMKQVF